MSMMFSKMKDFFHRHRNKFLVSGVLITSSVLLVRYAHQKLREWQERETKEFFERTRKQQHFESTERTCSKTVFSLTTALNKSLTSIVNTEEMIEELRSRPENKIELWEKLKILVFTRASCLIYLMTMLVVMLRIQLNIIGGQLFQNPTSVSAELQQKYLMLTEKLIGDFTAKLSKLVEKECIRIVGPMELTKQLKLNDLEYIFWSIQTALAVSEKNPIESLKDYAVSDEKQDSDIFIQMVQDTSDLLDSDEVKSLTNQCVNRGFVLLNDLISEFYIPNGGTEKGVSGVCFIHPSNIELPVAKLIPIINGLFAKKLPSNLAQHLLSNEKLKTLGANVYESFSSSK